jgi:PilZ domain
MRDATAAASMHVMERIKSWLRGPQGDRLPDGLERLLAAYYWDGAVPVPHEVRKVSAQGAYIVTSEKWYPGTIMDLSLEYNAQPAGTNPAPKVALGVRSRVVSHGPDGLSVEFVCVNRRERQELVKFLESVRSRGGQ